MNTARTNVSSHMVDTSLRRQLLQNILIEKPLQFSNDGKQKVLTWRNALLKGVKSHIDNNLNPAKVDVIDLTKDNFTQPLSIRDVLGE